MDLLDRRDLSIEVDPDRTGCSGSIARLKRQAVWLQTRDFGRLRIARVARETGQEDDGVRMVAVEVLDDILDFTGELG